ncbi:acyl-CoA dehydrogenase family protein [Amycolatopsis sp. H20-H5]|uniref:acyl-CoA dehydrogenase family protein n=1 Tax=Amycolatopsis sp. H20-H5 TaxID=3046309 RepID=UPI002DBB64B0|nr:acyl-CoA dehydrogenase [Amycolatopsis sp. H20-H5]MEC3975498.1 acyl-CoA dehydrogenase [Amycolatopsis sp. H20-H5]
MVRPSGRSAERRSCSWSDHGYEALRRAARGEGVPMAARPSVAGVSLQDLREALSAAFPATKTSDRSSYSREDWLLLGQLGLLGASVPAKLGGGGLNAQATAERFAVAGEVGHDTGLLFAAAAQLFACAMPLAESRPTEVIGRWLAAMCAGDAIAGNAMTEADAGSDTSRIATTATRVGGGYVLEGTKSWVSNGPVADVYLVYAKTDVTAGHLGITAFLVERTDDGVRPGRAHEKAGLRSCPAGPLDLRSCFVPDERVVGPAGAGAALFARSMLWERTCLFAIYVGLQQRLVDRCVAHARSRRQFGRPIGDFQAVADRIVGMKLRLETGRLLLRRAGAALDEEPDGAEDVAGWVAMAKLTISEDVVASALDAVNLFGGAGYLRDELVELVLRDSLPATIFSGTSDIQRRVIARGLGL